MKKTQSDRSRKYRSLVLTTAVAAAIGAVATLTPAALAQQRVGGDGRLNDASNLVGSGGFNDNSAAALPPGVFGNAIVSGDVSGGRGFQGNIPYFSPGAFHGNLGSSVVDNFVAGSTNVQTNGTIVNNAQNVHLFLGDNRGVNPPSGFISTGSQPGYIPAAVSTDSQFTSDTRLGVPAPSAVSGAAAAAIFQTGGAQGAAGNSLVTASPLFGQKVLQNAQQADGTAQFSYNNSGIGPLNSSLGSGDRVDQSADLKTPTLSDTTAMNPQAGLTGLPPGISSFATPQASSSNGQNNSPNQSGTSGSQNSNTNGGNNANGTGANNSANGQSTDRTNSNGPIDASINTQISAAVPSGYPVSSNIGANALSGGLNTGENSSTNIYSPTSNQPGSAYMRMIQRLKAINGNAPLTPVERNLLNQAKLQDIKTAQANGTAKPGISGSTPGNIRTGGVSEVPAPGSGQAGLGAGAAQPAQPGGLAAGPAIPQQVGSADKSKPVILNTFTGDSTSAGVKELLSKAEDLMKQGKFTSALEEYDLVEQQSPSNPFIQLGRANAELGASYYGLAEAHLRQAFTADQALLSAQLDLHTFLGEDKLQYLVKDLKQIAQANPTDERPVFLLAYICYNTNNARGAAAYLDLAQKREGKTDPFFELLKKNWDLPSISGDNGDTGLNK